MHTKTWEAPLQRRELGAVSNLGLVALATDVTIEADLRVFLPPDIALFVNRVRNHNPLRVLVRHPWAQLGVGLFMGLMVVTHFYAIADVEVAYMIAVKRTSLLFGMLYGAWLFAETGLSRNLVAGVLMILGIVLIAGW